MTTKNNSVSRRSFVQTTIKAAIGFTIIPRFVMGRGYLAPSDRISLGYIGTGKQSKSLINSFRSITQAVAGSDVDSQKLAAFQKIAEKIHADAAQKGEYKGFTGYSDFRELLERKELKKVLLRWAVLK